MNLTGKNFIAGGLSGASDNTFKATNPASGGLIEPAFHEATEAEINSAVEKAEAAFQEYRNVSGAGKAGFLEAIADAIMATGDDLISRCMSETGLPEARLKGERGRTVNQLKLFASYLREGSWTEARIDRADISRTPPRPDLRSMQRPLGPVGIFGASNFPLAFSVAGGDTASALAAGCTVVFKGHPAHPGTCELVAGAVTSAVKKCGMPEGTFSIVHGKSTFVGMTIVRHPLIKAIGFTGSFRGGKALFDAANLRPVPIPVYAEMGSTNPVFILPEALKERGEAIARDLAASVTLGTGQFCTNPGLVFVPGDHRGQEFIEAFSGSFREAPCGVMLTADIRANFHSRTEWLAVAEGVELVSKGKETSDGFGASAHLFRTSAANFLGTRELGEEVFGPSTLAVVFDDRAQLMEIAGKLDGHLTATLHGTEKELGAYGELIRILEQKAGRLIINGYPTGVEVSHAMVHGGPFPATTDSRTTSVGTDAIRRFTRPVCYQNFPADLLPTELRDENPLKIWRLVEGKWTV